LANNIAIGHGGSPYVSAYILGLALVLVQKSAIQGRYQLIMDLA